MKSWKTTLAGLLAGAYPLFQAVSTAYQAGQFTDKTGGELAIAVGIILMGAFAKDRNVTGGTVNQNTNAFVLLPDGTVDWATEINNCTTLLELEAIHPLIPSEFEEAYQAKYQEIRNGHGGVHK